MQIAKIFCVIDPTTNNQPALALAGEAGKATKAAVHAYLCLSPNYNLPVEDRADMRAAEEARYDAWVEGLIQPLRDDGIAVTSEIEFQDDWREALAPAATRAGADLIVKASYRRNALQRRLLKTADWTLLRAAECPVLLVKSRRLAALDKVLAAINLNAKDADHQALNAQIVDYAKSLAKVTGAELHAVNAHADSMDFVHAPDLAKLMGVERAKAHIRAGAPEEVVTELAAELGSPLVVIGSVARRGVTGVVVGNTAERILDALDGEILVVIHPRS